MAGIKIRRSLAAAGVLLLAAGVQPAAGADEVLGQVLSANVEMDGIAVPSGSTILSPSELQTGLEPAFAHLTLGYQIEMAPDTSATFEEEPGYGGEAVRVTVHRGTVSYRPPVGDEISTVLEGDFVILVRDDDEALLPPAGMPAKKKILIAAGAAVGAGLIIVLTDDDDERPASPVQP